MDSKWISTIACLAGIFLFQSSARAEITAVCNSDNMICGQINTDGFYYGLLPSTLQRHDVSDIKYVDYPDALLNDLSFDVALLPKYEAKNLLKNGSFTLYELPLKNPIIKLTPRNQSGDITFGTENACNIGLSGLTCVSISQALKSFNESLGSIVGFKSELMPFISGLSNLEMQETEMDVAYQLVINQNSPLAALDLRSDLLPGSVFDGYLITVIAFSFFLLIAGCVTAYVHYKSQIDEQSGCYSKKMFEKGQARIISNDISVMLIDYNNFKRVNDLKGHPVGDLVIERVSSELIHILRKNDKIYRIGGDEFFVEFSNALPETRVKQLINQMNQVAEKVSQELGLEELQFGLAVGHKTLVKGETLNEGYKIVDKQMYQQKKAMKAAEN